MSHLRLRLIAAVATALCARDHRRRERGIRRSSSSPSTVEGSSNNKALEIYNGTGAPSISRRAGTPSSMCFNGGTTAGLTINLTGTVAAGDVFVLAQASASATILAQADQTNGAGWFNGDDAVVLRKEGRSST